jgi:hypothetical protein
MNRAVYYNFIEEKLHTLANRISSGGKLNVLGLHAHSENFYLHFFNLLYGYELKNMNQSFRNVEAIDLIDTNHKVMIQVSSTNTKQKVENALSKPVLSEYAGFTFKFIAIGSDAEKLRNATFANPYGVVFNPAKDIHDVVSILSDILVLGIDPLISIYEFIRKELGNEIDIVKMDTNLAAIINILAKEKWVDSGCEPTVNSFDIDRKITYNRLSSSTYLIEEYKAYYSRIDAKYADFDENGLNASVSVLALIQREYLKLKHAELKADDVFFTVIEKLQEIVLNSSNFVRIPIDELELCIDILVVDAFIRCKIFENPENYSHVATR